MDGARFGDHPKDEIMSIERWRKPRQALIPPAHIRIGVRDERSARGLRRGVTNPTAVHHPLEIGYLKPTRAPGVGKCSLEVIECFVGRPVFGEHDLDANGIGLLKDAPDQAFNARAVLPGRPDGEADDYGKPRWFEDLGHAHGTPLCRGEGQSQSQHV